MTAKDQPKPAVTKRDPMTSPAKGTRSAGYGAAAGAPAATWTPPGEAAPAATPVPAGAPGPVPAPRKRAPPPPTPPAPTPFPPPELKDECEVWIARYPDRAAALIPILHVAQRKYGWLSPEVQAGIAKYLGVSDAHVCGVVTFYTMFNQRPVGRHHVQVCRTLSCWLRGASAITGRITKKTGLKPGETDKEGRFTLSEVECLGLCEVAPALFVNDTAHTNVTEESLDRLLDGLK